MCTTTGVGPMTISYRSRARSTGRGAHAMQKVGYDGTLMLEIAAHGSERKRSKKLDGQQRMERLFAPEGTARTFGPKPMHVYIEDIGKHEGEEVTIKGWLHNRRSSGKIHFLILRDGSGFIQAVMSKAAVGDELFKAADHLSQETSIIVTGTARADKRAPGGYEIDVSSWKSSAPRTTTRLRRRSTASTTCSIAAISGFAAERQQAILRVRHEIIDAVRDYFNSRGFILADTPIFTPAACEGTTTLFPVEYFDDQKAYLTQSGQLYIEANAMAFGTRVLLRSHVPRREIEDTPASHRVLDGRAGDGVCRSRTT